MLRPTVSLFVLIVTALLISACACHQRCRVDLVPSNRFGGLSAETVNFLQARQIDFAADFATHENVVIDGCCNLFTATLAARHCTPKIDEYCTATYADAEARAGCMTGFCREALLDRCLRDVYEAFRTHATTCSPMTLGATATDTKWTYPNGSTVRCPLSAPPPVH